MSVCRSIHVAARGSILFFSWPSGTPSRYVPHLYPFLCRWAFRLFCCLGCCEHRGCLMLLLPQTRSPLGFAGPPLSHHLGCSSCTVDLFPSLQLPSLHPDPQWLTAVGPGRGSLLLFPPLTVRTAALTLGNSTEGASLRSAFAILSRKVIASCSKCC